MNIRSFDASPETFEPPFMTYDATVRREYGVPPYGAIEQRARIMFDHFAWRVAAAASVLAGALCVG